MLAVILKLLLVAPIISYAFTRVTPVGYTTMTPAHAASETHSAPSIDKRRQVRALLKVMGGAALATTVGATVGASSSIASESGAMEEVAEGGSVLFEPFSNNVLKSQGDDREYKSMTLPNGLRVLLIQDTTANVAAAAMDVHVGSTSDPENIPGLAHFCEHMSFLGTEKYPREEDFSGFLSSHGGSTNAYTDQEDTVYYFDISADFLDDALDRFSQFFISPTFSQDARTETKCYRERAQQRHDDGFRLFQLEKDVSSQDILITSSARGTRRL